MLIGRGALANPFIFREIAGQATGEKDLGDYVRRLGALIEEHYPKGSGWASSRPLPVSWC